MRCREVVAVDPRETFRQIEIAAIMQRCDTALLRFNHGTRQMVAIDASAQIVTTTGSVHAGVLWWRRWRWRG